MSSFIQVNQSNFQETISLANKLVLIEITAPWCGACKSLEPILQEILTGNPSKIAVGILDADENSNLVNRLKIMSVPTIIVFQDGKEEKRVFGLVAKDELLKEIEI